MELNQIGVTPRKEAQFKKRGIESVEDLLRCYPKEYRDYRVPVSVRTLKDRQDERAAVLGIVTGCRILQGKHAMVRLKDKDGGNISAVWFNQAFRVRQVVLGGSYIVGGMARWDEQYQSVSFLMPDLFESFEGFRFGIKPVYRKIPGMSEEYFSSVMEEALSHIDDMGDYLNDEECKALDVPNTADTFRLAHLPESMEDVRRAQRRVLVDNMYPFCREMEMKRMQAAAESPFVPLAAFETMEQIRTFLPYQLTEDQKNALRRMLHEMKTGKRLDVLLQGDVGCGKTIVAIILAACMSKSGYQTAVVCPTSVLAGQHLQAFRSLLGKLDIKVAYLQGGMKAAERRALLKEVKSGAAGVVIGTHALFSPDVEFKALGLMIIDEEHRFGVKQKEALRGKAAQGVHSLSMSATPIPRSIAVAMYGEGTEVVNIRTLPNGRKPVKTILYSNEEKVYQSMMNQIGTGHQCYVVCPLIEESDNDTLSDVDSVETTMQKMTAWFGKFPQVQIEALTGEMKPEQMTAVIDRFAAGQTHILVSTTVVEVGVNVPNATVMLIKNAERFGLAQLHQLRGRVGRSDLQSYCVLLSDKTDNERLNTMTATNDGFEIAQKDLELRGTGQVLGVRQSGFDQCVDDMLKNPELYQSIRALIRRRAQKRLAGPDNA